jgi:hypothetical protein
MPYYLAFNALVTQPEFTRERNRDFLNRFHREINSQMEIFGDQATPFRRHLLRTITRRCAEMRNHWPQPPRGAAPHINDLARF